MFHWPLKSVPHFLFCRKAIEVDLLTQNLTQLWFFLAPKWHHTCLKTLAFHEYQWDQLRFSIDMFTVGYCLVFENSIIRYLLAKLLAKLIVSWKLTTLQTKIDIVLKITSSFLNLFLSACVSCGCVLRAVLWCKWNPFHLLQNIYKKYNSEEIVSVFRVLILIALKPNCSAMKCVIPWKCWRIRPKNE